MHKKVAIVAGVRTPFCKAYGALQDLEADELGAFAVRELLMRFNIDPRLIDEVILGNVLQPPHATNIARVISVKGGVLEKTPASTVNRNCASGMEAITSAANRIKLGQIEVALVGGVESMSQVPILLNHEMRKWLLKFSKERTFKGKFSHMMKLRPRFFSPQIPAISDPLCGLSMGETGERVARMFKVSREEQDAFACQSQLRADAARSKGFFAEESMPLPQPPKYNTVIEQDDGIRGSTTLEGLAKLPPAFDKLTGSVTAGNSSQVTDGACVLLIASEEGVRKLGLKPLAWIVDYAYAALPPEVMGLGPAYAIAKLLKQTNGSLSDFDLIEINEAFAAQVLAVVKALDSEEFCRKELDSSRIGLIDSNILNVNGGAISLGHPLGASGARITLTLMKELRRRSKKRGLAALCVGGGQGQALSLEVAE